jgi:D-alanyl-D-alanine carboxypeptidase (penicillin-binding protein 5/6)
MFNKLAKFTLPLVFGLFALICLPALLAKADAPPQISAVAAVVIDQASGKVLYDKDMNAEHYPASTTKVLTALLTLENMDIDDKITLPEDYVNVGETSIGLKAGARQTVEELLMALMLYSANDAGQALAIGVAGTEEAFVEMMNQRVSALGLQHTHFCNPHGLHNEDHYTSAYDLAMIARVAMDNPEFRRIVTTDSFTVRKLNGEDNFTVGNRNGLLSQYEYADGIKTGYTRQAGNCIVASATKNDMQLIVVVLNSPNIYEESQALLEWGFDNSQHNLLVSANEVKANVKVLNGGRNQVEVIAEKSLYSVMRTDENINVQESLDLPNSVPAPIHRGEVIGSVTYTDKNGYTYSTNLLAAKDVGRYNLRLVVRQSFQSVWQVFVVPFS